MGNVKKEKFKHPIGLQLANISITIQSFAGYAISSFLILFFTAAITKGGLGLSVPKATAIMGLYAGLGYMTPLIGGWLTDRYLGLQKGIILGAFLGGVGYLSLYFSKPTVQSLWIGLGIMIISGGFFKGNISQLVGELYSRDELTMKDAAYSIFYMATNIGSLLGPIVAGFVTDKWCSIVNASGKIVSYGYRDVFLLSSILMFVTCIIFFLLAPKWLKGVGKEPVAKTIKKVTESDVSKENQALTKTEKNRILAMFIVFFFVILYWTAWFQTQSSFSLLSQKLVNRQIGSFDIPVPWLISFNGILCVIFAPILGGLWIKLAKSKKGDLTIPTKMGLGMILGGLAFIVLILGVKTLGGVLDGTVKMNILFVLGAYFLLTMGELCLSPIGMSMFNKLAPEKYSSLAMGAWYLCFFFANLLSGKLAGFTASMGYTEVFGIIAGVVIVFGLILIFMRKLLVRLMALDEFEKEK